MNNIEGFKLVPSDGTFDAEKLALMIRKLVDEMVRQGFTISEALSFIAQLATHQPNK